MIVSPRRDCPLSLLPFRRHKCKEFKPNFIPETYRRTRLAEYNQNHRQEILKGMSICVSPCMFVSTRTLENAPLLCLLVYGRVCVAMYISLWCSFPFYVFRLCISPKFVPLSYFPFFLCLSSYLLFPLSLSPFVIFLCIVILYIFLCVCPLVYNPKKASDIPLHALLCF